MNHNAFQWVEIATLIGAGGLYGLGRVGWGRAGQDRGSGDGMS